MRSTIFFLLFLSGVHAMPVLVTAQNEACSPDLSRVSQLLSDAETALGADSLDTALELIAEARSNLELIEANCINFASDDAGNSRINPTPFGQRQRYQILDEINASIEITGFVDNANEFVEETDDDNDPPEEGKRYIVVELVFYCEFDPAQSCEFSPTHYNVVGSQGLVYEADRRVDGFFERTELFGGAQIPASIVYQVDEGDTDFVLFNAYDEAVFFATQ